MKIFFLLENLIQINIFVVLILNWLGYLSYYFSKNYNQQNILSSNSSFTIIKLILVVSNTLSLILYLIFVYFYINYIIYINNNFIFDKVVITPVNNFYFYDFSIDFFGLVLLFLAYIVGILSLMALDTRLY